MRLSAENLSGRTVIAADGQAVGLIKSIFLDAADWRVESVTVELRKDVADRIGAARSMFHRGLIEVPVTLIQSVGDAVVLAVPVDALRESLATKGTKTFLVLRHDKIVYEWYAPDFNRTKRHGTASMAKALVGATALQVELADGRLLPDDKAANFIPQLCCRMAASW